MIAETLVLGRFSDLSPPKAVHRPALVGPVKVATPLRPNAARFNGLTTSDRMGTLRSSIKHFTVVGWHWGITPPTPSSELKAVGY